MTITNQITDQSIGTSTNFGDAVFPQKVTLQETTTAVTIEALVVNGTGFYERKEIVVFVAVSSFDVEAADAPAVFGQSCDTMHLKLANEPDASQARLLERLKFAFGSGCFVYVWFGIPPLQTAGELSLNIIEMP